MTVLRILVTGSRRWVDAQAILDALTDAIAGHEGPVTIVHGACPNGADQLADVLIPTLGARVTVERWPANWSAPCRLVCQPGHRRTRRGGTDYCPAAGNYRNQEMVDARADLCVAFPLGDSPGTRDCMARAKAAGIRVVDITAPPEPETLW